MAVSRRRTMKEKPININIIDGDAFYAHELTVNYTPTQFSLDFKNITPRTDPRSQERPSFCLKHNLIMLDPWHAKTMLTILGNIVERYEKDYGKIKKPAAVVKAEKKQKKNAKDKNTESAPSYFG
ncbi:DUF3467 domain-containing protein [Candidatus Woesearchaeota archaeon]|nr:DUF3467 domain-containing protein [Candidatus Woesearchaeota archaeon]